MIRQRKSGKEESQKLKGVYSTPFEAKVKDGTKALRKLYWGVWVVGPDIYEIQPLNQNMVPMGQRQRISRADFERQFSPEPDFFINRTVGMPAEANAEGWPDGQQAGVEGLTAASGAPDEATLEAVSREMETLHAEGRAQLLRGEKVKALDTFRRILALQGPFVPEHKFVFNGCGIDMRKAKQLEEALSFYKKAIEVDQTDENLCHNIARVLYDKGDLDAALEYLRLGLSMNPAFKEAKQFASFIETRQGKNPKGKARASSRNVDKPAGKPSKKVYRF